MSIQTVCPFFSRLISFFFFLLLSHKSSLYILDTNLWWDNRVYKYSLPFHRFSSLYTYGGILFNLKNEGDCVIGDNTDETGGRCAEWNRQSEKHKPCKSPLTWGLQNSHTHLRAKSRMVVTRGCGKVRWEIVVQWIKRWSYARWKCSRDLLYGLVPVVNHTELHTQTFVKREVSCDVFSLQQKAGKKGRNSADPLHFTLHFLSSRTWDFCASLLPTPDPADRAPCLSRAWF